MAQRAIAGDPVARRQFAQRMQCVPGILAARNSRLMPPLGREEIDDVVQDTLVAIWNKLHAYAGQATLESWAYRFCVLELMAAARRRRRSSTEDQETLLREGPAIQDANPFAYEDLHLALEDLSAGTAEVLRMKHFDQLTFEEIGDALGESANTIKSRYYRGLAQIRASFDDTAGDAS